jgi:hypothetical protein
MSKKQPSPPPAPDPVVTAKAQGDINKETAVFNAYLNNVNQRTPYGNLDYTTTSNGKDLPPTFTATTTLSPAQQALLDNENKQGLALSDLGGRQLGRIAGAVDTPYNYNGIKNTIDAGDVNTVTDKAQSALMANLDRGFARDEEAMRTRLINQGIPQNSEAFDNEQRDFSNAKTDARNSAYLQALNFGGEAQQQGLQRRNQEIQEFDTVRNKPLNEYTGLTSGQQISNPQFQSTGYTGAGAADYAGLVSENYKNQLAAQNAKTSSKNSLFGALAGAAGTALGGPLGGAIGSGIGSMFSK